MSGQGTCCGHPRVNVIGVIAIVVLALLGVLFVVAGAGGPPLIRGQLEAGIRKLIVVDSKDAQGYDSFHSTAGSASVPVWFKVYVFNTTNAEDFAAGRATKPVVEQVGPYVYRENKVMQSVSFPEDGKKVKYAPWEYYTFEPAKSAEGLDPLTDTFTTANLPLAGVRQALVGSGDSSEDAYTWWQDLTVDVLASGTNSTMFVTKTVNELVWGYEVPLLELLAKAQPGTATSFGLQKNMTDAADAVAQHGFDVQKTGKDKLKNLKQYTQWANKTMLDVWATPKANTITGGDGLGFPPGVEASDSFTVFVDSAFRTVPLTSTPKDTSDVHGITLQNFRLDKDAMKNATEAPANEAYYAYAPTGVLNLTSATHAPVFMSKPHFLDGDASYREAVVGMHPDRKKHDTIIAVEPISGATMMAAKRLQVNVRLQPLLLLNSNMTSVYLPVAWFQEGTQISAKLASKFKTTVYGALNLETTATYVGFGAGAFFIVAAIVVGVVWRLKFYRPRSSSVGLYHPVNAAPDLSDTLYDTR